MMCQRVFYIHIIIYPSQDGPNGKRVAQFGQYRIVSYTYLIQYELKHRTSPVAYYAEQRNGTTIPAQSHARTVHVENMSFEETSPKSDALSPPSQPPGPRARTVTRTLPSGDKRTFCIARARPRPTLFTPPTNMFCCAKNVL